MASVSFLYIHPVEFRTFDFTPFDHAKGNIKCRKPPVICSKNSEPNQIPRIRMKEQQCRTKRREILLQVVFTTFSFPLIASDALAENDIQADFRVYAGDTNKFNIMIPQDWQVGAGEANGIRSLTAFYPEEASNSNVSLLITGLGADFTRMESFGKVDAFADTLVSGIDRSWQRPPGVAAKLIDCKASNGFYYIEYSLQKPGESCRHIFSAIGMASNGWYNRLYTVTGQFMEEESGKYRSKVEKSVASFRLI